MDDLPIKSVVNTETDTHRFPPTNISPWCCTNLIQFELRPFFTSSTNLMLYFFGPYAYCVCKIGFSETDIYFKKMTIYFILAKQQRVQTRPGDAMWRLISVSLKIWSTSNQEPHFRCLREQPETTGISRRPSSACCADERPNA